MLGSGLDMLWLRTGSNGGALMDRVPNLRVPHNAGVHYPAEILLSTFQEAISYIELVCWYFPVRLVVNNQKCDGYAYRLPRDVQY